jgi:NitT/TauT family transport system permease protein
MKYLKNRRMLGISGLIAILLMWCAVFFLGLYPKLLVPSPTEVFLEIFRLLVSGKFWLNFTATFIRVFVAFAVSAVAGIFFGLIVGYYKIANDTTEPLIDFIRSIPAIILFPLFILLFGIGDVSRLLVAITLAVPIILINTKYGVINSSQMRKNLGKLYKMKNSAFFFKVILPGASPYIFTGLKISVSLILIVVIVTEMMLGTAYGIGHLAVLSQYQFEIETVFALIILLGIFGFLLNFAFNRIEKSAFHWKEKA